MPVTTRHPASYKDPSGFIYFSSGKIYRQVNKIYSENYSLLKDSGLYELLVKKNLLLPHKEVNENLLNDPDWHFTLIPEQINFWSYPYEWSFDQLKDAALLTLDIMFACIEKGMILKDATPYNVQINNGKPIFIDSLSFEIYDESQPWIAYRQFCESFLYPLLLSHYHKNNFQNQLIIYPDGLPVEMVAKLLPAKSNLNLGVWLHVTLPDKLKKKENSGNANSGFSKKKLTQLISHLKNIIFKLDNSKKSNWSNYYTETISGGDYTRNKEKIVLEMLKQVDGNKLLDLGANDGHYSWLASNQNFNVIAIDNDEQSINNFYKKIKKQNNSNILPLCIDICSPTPALGFLYNEKDSFHERVNPDVVMALALVHHLAIGKNMPLDLLAENFNRLAPQLIIEFVPKEDEKTKLLLKNRNDIFTSYNQEAFENVFKMFFEIKKSSEIDGTNRTLYFMKRLNK